MNGKNGRYLTVLTAVAVFVALGGCLSEPSSRKGVFTASEARGWGRSF